jgi:hypothetical protein
MRKLLVSTVVSLAWVIPALAQDAPGQAAAASAAHGQQGIVNQAMQSFEQRVHAGRLQQHRDGSDLDPHSGHRP